MQEGRNRVGWATHIYPGLRHGVGGDPWENETPRMDRVWSPGEPLKMGSGEAEGSDPLPRPLGLWK